jgi:hypothetical protein
MARNYNNVPVENAPYVASVSLTAANTARDGSGTITTLATGTADGLRIDKITFISAQATAASNSAMVGRIFLSFDSGSTWTLYDEIAIIAVTASNTAVGIRNPLTYSIGLKLLGTTVRIGVTISVYAGVQDRTSVIAEGGDLAA